MYKQYCYSNRFSSLVACVHEYRVDKVVRGNDGVLHQMDPIGTCVRCLITRSPVFEVSASELVVASWGLYV